MIINGVSIDETFAEAFPMKATRAIITAQNEKWAMISAHGMEEFTAIPKHVTQVIVCADNDYSFTGQAAALFFPFFQ